MKYITRPILVLSLISLFTDMASEMLYPVMPLYLQSIGFSAFYIGILEGIAEATTGLGKGYFGKLSDISGRRVPFVQVGYALSAIAKPLMIIFTHPLWVFLTRLLDRTGKGVRTAARDAILAAESSPAHKGKIFGFHRTLDTLGAVIGPLLALLYLSYAPGQYTALFVLSIIPGLLAILLSLTLKESSTLGSRLKFSLSFHEFLHYWKNSPVGYKKLTGGLFLFALINSSDMFLLLKARQNGISDLSIIYLYVFYNLIYAATSFPLGIIGDKKGLKNIFLGGLLFFALTYGGIALADSTLEFLIIFTLYGIYAAATEGIAKGWISHVVPDHEIATALGLYATFQSIGTMIASTLTGLLWHYIGSSYTLTAISISTLLIIIYFLIIVPPPQLNTSSKK